MAIDVPPRPSAAIQALEVPSPRHVPEASLDVPRRRPWEELGFAPWVEPLYRRARPHLPTAGFVLAVYGAARLIVFMGDLFAAHLNFGGDLAAPMQSWDARWYLQVAQTFYPAHAAMTNGHLAYGAGGFAPLFPALIRLGMLVQLTPFQSATVVSLVGGTVATLLVWRLGANLVGEDVGRVSAVLFVLFPGMGVVWGLLYSESVGLALVAASLLLMVHKRWIWAGLVGALATATSPMALPLVLPALAEGVYGLRRRRDLAPLACAALVPMGFVGYAAGLGLRYHDALFWWHLQHQGWDARVDFGRSLLNLLWHPLSGGYQGKGWMEWIGLFVAVVAVAAIYRAKLPSPVPLYCLGVFGLAFVSNSLGFKPRFLAWAFPALVGVAALTWRRGWQVVAMTFAGAMPFVFLLYTMNANYIIQP